LAFPPESAGEVSRVTFYRAKGVPTQERKVSGNLTQRSYVVRAECSASGPGVAMTYLVFDSKSPRPANGGRVQTSGVVSCDAGKVTVRVPPLYGDAIQMRFSLVPDQVTRAYAVLVPQ